MSSEPQYIPIPSKLAESGQDPYDTGNKALIHGGIAALVGGAIWAGIVVVTNTEVGYVAWGIGAFIGYAMSHATVRRGWQMAFTAALFAVVGLAFGKVLIVEFSLRPAVVEELAADPLGPARAAAWQLRESGGFPDSIQAQLDAMGPADTLSDALWEEMVSASAASIAIFSADQRDTLSAMYAEVVSSSIGFTDLFLSQLSGWDLLWVALALSTAWRMLNRDPARDPVALDEAPAT